MLPLDRLSTGDTGPCSRELITITLRAALRLANTVEPDEQVSIIRQTREAVERLGGTSVLNTLSASPSILFGTFDERMLAFPIDKRKELGSGGANTVSQAIEGFTGRMLAVREPRGKFRSVVAEQETIVHEESLSQLPPHKNIITCWGQAVDQKGNPYDIIDFASGTNLNEYLSTYPLTLGDFFNIALQMTDAIDHMHRHGHVHGDIKPANFMVEKNQEEEYSFMVKAIDLDLLRPFFIFIEDVLKDKVMGTPLFMAGETFVREIVPEQSVEQQRFAQASDIYALGITFYRMLTGSYPREFLDKTVREMFLMKANGDPLALDFASDIPSSLQWTVRNMCQADWSLRPPIAEVREHLSQLMIRYKQLWDTIVAAPSCAEAETDMTGPRRYIGPYQLVHDHFAPYRIPGTNDRVSLAELIDKGHRRLVAIPKQFQDSKEAQKYFEERRQNLFKLNDVRKKYPTLFPGKFDVVLDEEKNIVWVVRPLLDGALPLHQYLKDHPDIVPSSRFDVMRQICESLGALEEEGYEHPELSIDSVYLVPPSYTPELATVNRDTLLPTMKADLRFFTFPGSLPYRLELMNTNMAHERDPRKPDKNIRSFITMARKILSISSPELAGGKKKRVNDLFRFLQRNNLSWKERMSMIESVQQELCPRQQQE